MLWFLVFEPCDALELWALSDGPQPAGNLYFKEEQCAEPSYWDYTSDDLLPS